MHKQKNKSGFTLVELLVVVSIIALLVSILMPALGKARAQAKNIMCKTNIRSLQTGTILYTMDNNDKMMPQSVSNTYGVWGNLWIEGIASYCEDVDEIRHCPNTRPGTSSGHAPGTAKRSWRWGGYIDSSGTTRTIGGSYAINGWFYNYSNYTPPTTPPDFQSMIYKNISNTGSSPALIPFFSDSAWVDVWPVDGEVCSADLNLSEPDVWSTSTYESIEKLLMNRHGRRTNISFLDGHQESVDLERVWSLKWNKKFIPQGIMYRANGDTVYP